MVQKKPAPSTVGLWIEVEWNVSDAFFENLIPKMTADLDLKNLEEFIMEQSPLYNEIFSDS